MATQVASLYASIGADLSGLNKGLSQAQSKLKSAGRAIGGVGRTLSAAITAPLVGIGVASVKMAADFEQSMALVGVAMDGTGTDMEQVRQYALKMGADTVYNAQEMSEAILGLAKAGQDWTAIAGDMSGDTGTLAAVTDLAAASDLSLAQAADAVAVAMATFNRPAEDAVDIVDNLVQAADASVAEVDGLAKAITFVGSTAAAAGYPLEDTTTALALLSEAGLDAGRAGRNLQSMLASLQNPSTKAYDAMSELGIEIYDTSGNMKKMPAIIDEINAGLAGLTQEERDAALGAMFTNAGIRAALPLLAAGADGWAEMGDKVATAATAQDVADAKMGGFAGTMEQFSGAMETLGIKVGTVLLPILTDLLKNHIIPFIDRITELNPKTLKLGIILGGLAAAAGPVLMILGGIVTAIGAIGAPVLAVIAAIGGLAAAFATNFGGVRDTVMGWWAQIQPIVMQVVDWFKTQIPIAIQAFGNVANAVLGEVGPFIQGLFQQIVDWFVENWPLMQETFQTVVEAIKKFWDEYGPAITQAWQQTWDLVKTILSEALNIILQTLTLIMQIITGDWEGALNTLKNITESIWNIIKAIFLRVLEAILTLFQVFIQRILESWLSKLGAARDVGKAIINALRKGVVSKAKALVKAAVDAVKNALKKAKEAIGWGSPPKEFVKVGEAMSNAIALGIEKMASKPVQAMAHMMGGMGSNTAQLAMATAGAGVEKNSTTNYWGENTININDGRAMAMYQEQQRQQARAQFGRY